MTRVEAAANEVHMRVDAARNHRRSPQVDRLRTRPDRVGIVPEFGDAAIADRDRRNDAALIVHRQESAVDERKILRAVTLRRPFPWETSRRSRCISRGFTRGACEHCSTGRERRTLDEIAPGKTTLFLVLRCHCISPLKLRLAS